MRSLLINLLIIISIVASAQDKKNNAALDKFIREGMEMWQIPGMAVTVVKQGQVVFEKGYGIADITTKEPVNLQTMFANASTTKAFVAMGIAMLVDEGKINWDDRVIDHLTYFRLADPYVTQDARVVDLLTHNLGLQNTNLIWIIDSLSSRETIMRMEHAELSYGMRGNFIYQNIMYAAAGEVIHAVTGKPWNEYLRENLWEPLDMTRTVGLVKELEGKDNFVAPHVNFEDRGVDKVPYMVSDAIGAAGMMWSSIEDMSKWMKFLIDSTRIGDERLISAENFEKLLQPHAIIPPDQFYPTAKLTEPNWTTYGLGWFQHDYKGKMVNFHTGSLAGLVALAGLMPEEELGVFIFANLDHAELRHAIMYKVFDQYALGGDRNWNKEIDELYDDQRQERLEKEAKQDSMHIKGTKASLDPEKYSGTYTHEVYGDVKVKEKNGKLFLQLKTKDELPLSHYHFNTFETTSDKYWLDEDKVNFQLNASGEVESLTYSGGEFTKYN